ncbi:regulatory signaling modulator protein AmpE [Acidihalobacter yilgarnensis]|uniref:regulatory signaling modulator protein AmpE n=1 Tax=Acidihalobacter yilgarnensis TaxID=2819280 RepID=UPI0009F2334C|nr:regulatory signaling modulator protein AmpE [Acidihalobacter yilgarnensis]
MTLITLLLALALERFLGYMSDFRDPRRLNAYAERLSTLLDSIALKHPGLKLLLIVLPPILLVGWLQSWLSGVLLGLPGLIFGVAVLLYCLGPEDLEEEINNYVEAVAVGDEARQRRVAARLLGEVPPDEPVARARRVALAGFSESNDRLFTVIFWFVLLGPAAAVLYRLIHGLARLDPLATEETDAQASEEEGGSEPMREQLARVASGLAALMEWAPARLAALGYAVTGSFDHALVGLRERFWGGLPTCARAIVSCSARAVRVLCALMNCSTRRRTRRR